jgi:histidine triad (HIT) family protein
MPTLFERIASREIPADIVYEDPFVLAFRDIDPQAPFHVLVVPRRAFARIAEPGGDEPDLLGRLLLAANEVVRAAGLLESGYRVIINQGADAGQAVPHLHLHVMAGRPMGWPPG